MLARIGVVAPHVIFHGHLVLMAMSVYAVAVGVHHQNQIDKVLRRYHECQEQVAINSILNHNHSKPEDWHVQAECYTVVSTGCTPGTRRLV